MTLPFPGPTLVGPPRRVSGVSAPGQPGDVLTGVVSLDLSTDVVSLTRQLVDIESVSRGEEQLADAVEAALRGLAHLSVTRHQDRKSVV